MATPSTISIIRLDGSVSRTYCRLDGYLDANGQTLFLHYQNLEKIEQLISLGHIDTLAPYVDSPVGGTHKDNITTFWGRDLGFKEWKPQHFQNLQALHSCYRHAGNDNLCLWVGHAYDFFFKEENSTWYVQSFGNLKMDTLAEAILKDPHCVDTPAFIQINRDILERGTPLSHEEAPQKANLKI